MAAVVAVMAMAAFGCGIEPSGLDYDCGPPLCLPPGTIPSDAIAVEMNNTTPSAAHLFWANETFPCCRVEPGSSRVVPLIGLTIGSIVGFRAELGGQVVATAECVLTSTGFNAARVAVVFSAPQQLTCQGW